MASEIRVDKINSLSGVGTVTLSPTGVDISGITTAATLKATTGIVTTLTATTGIVTTLTTNTLTANSTAKVGSGVTLSPDGDVFVTGVTTSTTVKVGGGVTISESGIEASGIGITVANINGGAVSGRRNMIINGDQRVAQRGTTAVLVTDAASYRHVDRFKTDLDGSGGGNWFIAQTGAGTSIAADVPTGQGFAFSSKATVNATVSQPTSTSVHHQFYTMLERQDITHLEWGTSAAKACTLSFWVKGSITGTYGLWIALYGSSGGSNYYYWTNYTIDSANTWEKKVITVTGPTSGGAITATNDLGLRIEWLLGAGSDCETGTLNEWTTSNTIRTASGTVFLPENAGATWYITGIQFEVGSQATAFEHRSMAEELALCQRYYFQSSGYTKYGAMYNNSHSMISLDLPVTMRTDPGTSTATVGTNSGTVSTNYSTRHYYQQYVTGDVSTFATDIKMSAEL